MKKLIGIFSLSFLVILASNIGFAQERQLKGQVTVFDSIAVINAQVLVKSTDSIYKTDENGMFQIHCSNKDQIVVRANGFVREKKKIKEDTEKLNINLKLKNNPKSRELAIGYGHVKERDKLFASSSLNDDNNDFSTYSNMLELIEGRFSGVDTQGGKVVIRGISSISDDSTPLIIVDGIKVDYQYFNMMAPADVKSINIIKDGTTAMYGVEGGNGVIVIETKKKIE